MKKNRTMKLACVLLALAIMTSCFVGGTFAKYTSTANGTATATVAKWSFKQGTTELEGDDTVTFNLFETIKEEDGSADESAVVTGLIAPGTSGAFALEITNDSEVNAKYSISYTVETTDSVNVPIEFSTDGTTWGSLQNVVDEALEIGEDVTINVQWRWAFTGNDTTDTTAGKAAPTVTVTAAVTFTQVDTVTP